MNLLNMLPSTAVVSLFPARQRSGAGTTNGTGQDVSTFEGMGVALLDVNTESGTTPTLDVKLQESDTVGGTYTDIAGAVFTQVTAGAVIQSIPVDLSQTKKFVRAVATEGGTSPVFAFGVTIRGVKKY